MLERDTYTKLKSALCAGAVTGVFSFVTLTMPDDNGNDTNPYFMYMAYACVFILFYRSFLEGAQNDQGERSNNEVIPPETQNEQDNEQTPIFNHRTQESPINASTFLTWNNFLSNITTHSHALDLYGLILNGGLNFYGFNSVLNHATSLPSSCNFQTTSNNSSVINSLYILTHYNPDMERYLKTFKKKKVNNSTLATTLKISDEDLKPFIDFITTDVMNVPVTLNKKPYNLKTLLKLPKINGKQHDPTTRDIFYLRDIQPAPEIQEKFEQLVGTKYCGYAESQARNAMALFKENKFKEAIETMTTAISLRKKVETSSERLAIYHYNISAMYAKIEDTQKAILHCETSLEMLTESNCSPELKQKAQDKLNAFFELEKSKPNSQVGLNIT